MPPRLLGFVRSKIITFFYLALIIPCLFALTNQTFAQEAPVQPATIPSTPLIHIVRKTDDLSAQSKLKQQILPRISITMVAPSYPICR